MIQSGEKKSLASLADQEDSLYNTLQLYHFHTNNTNTEMSVPTLLITFQRFVSHVFSRSLNSFSKSTG